MKRTFWSAVLVLVLGAAGGLGYWLGLTRPAPEGRPVSSPEAASAPEPQRKILYYRNPMGLADTSASPKKDAMGMDYIPVYEGEERDAGRVSISAERMQRLGVRTEAATMRELSRTVRAVGTLQVNERMQRTVSPRFEGWIQRLLVATTGERVRRGQPLMEVYSPELVAAQQEYLIARRGAQSLKDAPAEMQANMKILMESSLQRLRNWDIPEEDLLALQQEGRARSALTLRSPVEGVVIDKPSVQGMRFMPGEPLYRIADLSSLWLIAEVFEQDLLLVRPGQSATVRINAYPGRELKAAVTYIYPTTNAQTRTTPVRLELPNPGGMLRPAMYASIELAGAGSRGRVLTVPTSAVIDSGTRKIALVALAGGRFEPRELKLGMQSDDYVEVLRGVAAGDEVVVSANFLIDAESNLKAAIGGFKPADQGAMATDVPEKTHSAEGTVEAVDARTATASIAHGPVASLKWPGMTMDFRIRDAAVAGVLRPGARIRFEFTESSPGNWTIVRAAPASAVPGTPIERGAGKAR